MFPSRRIGARQVGPGNPVYVIAEIGINHNGDLGVAKELMRVAASAGCDAVKFQKRTPDLCVPDAQKLLSRETPWGVMSYLDYKRRIEFGTDEYDVIDAFAGELGITWFASPWDEPSVEFLARYDPPCIKIASASLTDDPLLTAVAAQGTAVMLSTGMSTMEEIDRAVGLLPADRLLLAHATSTYPCPPEELNLRMIPQLAERFGVPVGYSGHETGLQTTLAAVVLGATFIERHVTLDRAMWGSDHAASVEPSGLQRLVRDVRVIESALGDGHKRVYDSEVAQKAKLRRT